MARLVIIGYGKIGKRHRQVFEAQGAQIVASCNRSEAGRQMALKDGIPQAFESIPEMLESMQPDGIICSTSIFNNYEVAQQIIPFQIPILLEKPPGVSITEVQHLIDLQQEYQTPVMIATNRVWYSVLRKAVEDIGGLDQIRGVDVIWSENPERLKERGFTDEQIHTRTFSNSIHGLSILHYLCGTIPEFEVTGRQQGDQFQRDMSLQGISERGVLSRFQSSWSSILPWEVRFYGNNKYYSFQPLEKCQCKNLQTKETYEIEAEEYDLTFKAGFYQQAETFLASLAGKAIPAETKLQTSRQLFRYAQALTDQFEAHTAYGKSTAINQ